MIKRSENMVITNDVEKYNYKEYFAKHSVY